MSVPGNSAATRVEVWWSTPLAGPADLLDDPELVSISGLRDRADRARAITARALLRVVCGAAFAIAPREVTFAYACAVCGGPHGKPFPQAPPGERDVHVSVSRAGELVAVAWSRVGPVGLDVERCRATGFDGFDEVALTAGERDAIARRPESERAVARTSAWVRKEALLKLYGIGLSRSPSDIDVRDDVAYPPVEGIAPGSVRLTDIAFGADYRACVATATERRTEVALTDARPILAAAAALARTATA